MPITSKFLCLNGRFLKEEDLFLDASNRAFRYGDGFFETMHYANGKVQLFDLHQKRMQKAMKLLQLESPILLHQQLLHKEIVHLINANHFFKGARIRISIFRDGKGLYLPESNNSNYLIESWALKEEDYPLNTTGLSIDIYPHLKKASGDTLFYKSLDSRISILASLYKKEFNIDDCFILNNKGEIIESISSNVFFIRQNTIYTPSKTSGCIHGIMREQILKTLSKNNFKIDDKASIKPQQITEFDEIFISNAIRGIQWIGAYKEKRFDHKIAQKIQKLVVNQIFDN